jgi:AcrR family transcriptional regulator
MLYRLVVPKLWTETIAAHRREVRDAIMETTAALVAKDGLRSVTMSQIAEATGIGRATLYKYFPDVDAILVAWHERHIAAHLKHLAELRERPGTPIDRLEAVLAAYARIQHKRHASEVNALLHRDDHVAAAEQHLTRLIQDVLAEARKAGDIRDDVAPSELAIYCLFALAAARRAASDAAVQRLVDVTVTGLKRPN